MYPPPPPPGFRPRSAIGWLSLFALGNALFAAGSALLGAGALDWVLSGDYGLFNLRGPSLALMILCGWPVLFLAVARMGSGEARVPRSRRRFAALAAGGALAGAVGGILALPLAFPAYSGGFWGWYEWQYILFYGYFAYVPLVFAPALAGHAALAIAVARGCRDPTAEARLALGAFILAAVAGLSLLVELSMYFDGPAWGLVGLAVPGYVLVSLGALRERHPRTTGAPSRGPAAPSPGPWP